MPTEKEYKTARLAELEQIRVLTQATGEGALATLNKAIDHYLAGHSERWLTLEQWLELHKVSGDELIAELQHEENRMIGTFGSPWVAAKEGEQDEGDDDDDDDPYELEEFFECSGNCGEDYGRRTSTPELVPGEFTCCATCGAPFCYNCILDDGNCHYCDEKNEDEMREHDYIESLPDKPPK